MESAAIAVALLPPTGSRGCGVPPKIDAVAMATPVDFLSKQARLGVAGQGLGGLAVQSAHRIGPLPDGVVAFIQC